MAQHMLRRLCLVIAILLTLMSPTDASWKKMGQIGRSKRGLRRAENIMLEAQQAGSDTPIGIQSLMVAGTIGTEFAVEMLGEAVRKGKLTGLKRSTFSNVERLHWSNQEIP